jgi:hypothetical protein
MSLRRKKLSKGTTQTPHGSEVELTGRFRFNGSSDPTSKIGNWISSVAHTSTGVWTVTMKDPYKKLYGAYARNVSLEMDASALNVINMGAYDEALGTFIIRVYTESAGTLALADIAAGSNDGNWCHMRLSIKASNRPDNSGL